MSEERISVAELLARGGGGATPAGGRRRRHAGGENSITVAELTGEIPVVRDDLSAEDIAADGGQVAEQAPVATPEDIVAAPAEAESAEVEAVEAEAVEVEQADAGDAQVTEVEQATAEESEDGATTSSSLAAAVAQGPAVEEAPRIDPSQVEYTGYAEHGAAIEADEEPVEAADVQAVADDAQPADGTEEDRNFAWSQWTENHPPVMATADFNTAQVRERQARFAQAPEQDTVDVAPVADEQTAAPQTAALGLQDATDATDPHPSGQIEQLVDDSAAPVAADTDVVEDTKAAGTSAGRGWLLLIAEVVIGLAAGAGLFYGFFKLWNWGGGMPTIALTVVLAFVVVIAIVTFTHYLRKTTDYLTLGLALFVGLVITFGPLLMSLGSN